ncbi:MAG: radical SAM family heme chaperone HemW [Eubacterium sp.]|nr:radical SAM family heme chaperone HemW [Eubacterium sp.]
MMNKTYEKGIYIHIPFCVHKCIYCDFLSAPADDAVKYAYTKALINEIRNTADKQVIDKQINDNQTRDKITSIFFGGGTPSVLPDGCIADILMAVRDCFDIEDDAEITMECNPGTVNESRLSEYRAAGVNRLSFGLQSADNNELKMLGRIHTFEQFVESFRLARKAGFNNINVDLMSAIPGQTEATLENTFDKVMALQPEHISVYSLILEDGTYLADNIDKFPPVPDEDEDRRMYHMTKERLHSAGYERYEISNYSRKGFECRHNLLYWNRGEYYGFGCSAAGFIGNERYSDIRDVKKYIELNGDIEKLHEKIEILTKEDAIEEFMFLGLRKMAGVDVMDFQRRFGVPIENVYAKEIEQNIDKGLLIRQGDMLKLTEYGTDICNTVMSDFILTDGD